MGGVYNPFNLNLYAYTYQNPLGYTDPSGGHPLLVIWGGKAVLEGFGDVVLDKGIAHLSGEEYGFKDAVKSFAGGFLTALVGAGFVNKIKKLNRLNKLRKAN